MRNVVLTLAFSAACGPHPTDPQTTDFPDVTSTTVGTETATDGATGENPTTEVQGSTTMSDTDDPVVTTATTTTTTDADTDTSPTCPKFVMCGDDPCTDQGGEPICAPDACQPMPCGECPAASFCGEIDGQSVCVVNDEVPCAAPCMPVLCEDCPTDDCVTVAGLDLCVSPETNEVMCEDELPPEDPACEPLGPCMNDTDCPAGAATCWDFLKMGPVVAGEPGQCVSACTSPDECPAGIQCSSKGFCADDQTGSPVCTQP